MIVEISFTGGKRILDPSLLMIDKISVISMTVL